MKCLVCCQKIEFNEEIFWGNQMKYCGPGEDDCSYSNDSEGLMGAIHLFCLENPVPATKTPNTVPPDPVIEESVVQRSDALAIFEGDL